MSSQTQRSTTEHENTKLNKTKTPIALHHVYIDTEPMLPFESLTNGVSKLVLLTVTRIKHLS